MRDEFATYVEQIGCKASLDHEEGKSLRAAQRKGLSLRRGQDRGRYVLVDPDFDAPMRSLDCRLPTPSRSKKPRDTLPNNRLRACALS
jgi:hypothetical protein